MDDKKVSRLRRAQQTRRRISKLRAYRLSVFRSNSHIYANVISPEGDRVLASASTLEATVKGALSDRAGGKGSNKDAAAVIGKLIAERSLSAGITNVAFDRSGFAYHGRIKSLAEAAREAGLKF
jgi:large subunit ribosomal protein L18